MKTGWAHKLKNAIWEHTRLPCVFEFKVAGVRNVDVYTEGKCRTCDATVFAQSFRQERCRDVKVNIWNYNDKIRHTEKRRIKMKDSQTVLDKLKTKPASVVQNELARKMMRKNDLLPPSLSSANAYRIAKCRSRLKGVEANPTMALLNLSKKYPGCIQHIGN